ncbi:Uncharacterised protein [Mycobacteroides abscessus]|nr:Uncharacterised protein [Mycobacteroides abscessus]SKN98883.1 Uncharacterised protein [Mycobacteroides abscessus subsp. massiliense]
MARSMPRATSGDPSMVTAAKPLRFNAIGSSGTSEWVRTNRRSATDATGSSSSTGPISGATSWAASR